jgi:signal transduction histidine kinase
MKAATSHYLDRIFAECSSHEVLGGTHRQAPFMCIGQPMREIGARLRAIWPCHFLTDERRAERERIARELHDTLLQGLQGVLLEMELFSHSSSLAAEQRERATKIEQQLRDVVTSGRDAISALRSPVDEKDWMAAILDMGDRLAMEWKIEFSLCIKGDPWNPKSKVRCEVLAIVREGLRNAFGHSHAHDVRVILNFAKRGLRISIRDNGIGVSEQQMRLREREGHWGMAGMRERSEKLGGRLMVTSQLSVGTVIEVIIPRRPNFMMPPALFISGMLMSSADDEYRQEERRSSGQLGRHQRDHIA